MGIQTEKRTNENKSDSTEIEELFLEIDRGINDVEANRVHIVDEAFRIIRDKMKREIMDIQKGT